MILFIVMTDLYKDFFMHRSTLNYICIYENVKVNWNATFFLSPIKRHVIKVGGEVEV
jgi:hypothetical protein